MDPRLLDAIRELARKAATPRELDPPPIYDDVYFEALAIMDADDGFDLPDEEE